MDFGNRQCTLPECHSVTKSNFQLDTVGNAGLSTKKKGKKNTQIYENSVYKNVKEFDHNAHLASLIKLTSMVIKSENVWRDKLLLERIFYRNWNQHKNSVYFRRLYELRRALRIFDRTCIRDTIIQTLDAFYDESMTKNNRRVANWQSLPCQHYMTGFAGRIAHITLLVNKLIDICTRVYVQFSAQMAKTLFMPLSMIMQGISARMYVIFSVWRQDLTALYSSLLEWLPYLPQCPDGLKGKTAPIAKGLLDPTDLVHVPEFNSHITAKIKIAANNTPTTPSESSQAPSVGIPRDAINKAREADELGTAPQSKKKLKPTVLDLYDEDDLGGLVE